MKMWKSVTAATAIAALTVPQVAFAQQCIAQADLSDTVIYAMPSLVSALDAKCASTLPAGSMNTLRGADFLGKYRPLQSKSWPGAQRVLTTFAQGKAGASTSGADIASLIGSMPAETMRPFVDAMVQQEVAKAIPVKECGKIARAITLLAPLPPENIGGLASFIFSVADVKNPSICENGKL